MFKGKFVPMLTTYHEDSQESILIALRILNVSIQSKSQLSFKPLPIYPGKHSIKT